MGRPITNVTIVGGGTAGWIVAAYLNHRLQWGLTARPGVTVTVIESPGVGAVGVGEATVPTLKGTLRILEISEAEFIERTNASFKLGIRFDGWQVDEAGRPYSYVHPFTAGSSVRGRNPGYAFQRYGLPGEPRARGEDFVRSVSHAAEAIEQLRGPRALDAPAFSGALQYAYHVDAALLAGFLKEVCLARGVDHVRDDVAGVTLDDRGFIAALRLKERGAWPVELVIDCSGFRALLIGEALEEPFVPYSEFLLNDRAVALQVRRGDGRSPVPATVATALDAGWAWRTPLHSRDGTGYVYSSGFKSDAAAVDELLGFLGGDTAARPPSLLKMRVGRSARSWVKNCVAIGLSSGFLEPLESTGILSIELASRWLLQNFPSADFEEPLAGKFNHSVRRFYEEVRDFLGLHFALSNRHDTPYWRAQRHELKLSDELRENLALWKQVFPSPSDARSDMIFSNWSVQTVLFGKGFYRGVELGGTELVPEEVWRWHWAAVRAEKRDTLARLPAVVDLVQAVRARAVPGETSRRKPKGASFSVDEGLILSDTRVVSPLPQSRLHVPESMRAAARHVGR